MRMWSARVSTCSGKKRSRSMCDGGNTDGKTAFDRAPEVAPERVRAEEALGHMTQVNSEIGIVKLFIAWLKLENGSD